MLDLEPIKARVATATPEPWAVPVANVFRVLAPEAEHHNPRQGITPEYPWRVVCEMGEADGRAEDAEFISHARADVPALVSEVERLREALNDIASWKEGPEVDGRFDEPASARRAREALA